MTKRLAHFSLSVFAGSVLVCVALPSEICAQTTAATHATHGPEVTGRALQFPPSVAQALDRMYGGDSDAAITTFHQLQQSEPRNPLGYVLEAEARWWKIYCAESTVKWGMVDVWKRGKRPSDGEYLALLDREITLANDGIAAHDSAEMHLYAGIGLAMKAQLYGLQGENHATARAAVAARYEFMRSIEMNPNLADAYTGLGLYNYFVDTLAPMVKVLRWMMGMPGGNRELGIQQLERGMKDGQLTAVEARFYLAASLRTYDHDYQHALIVAQPLTSRYASNPVFLLLIGNLQQELGNHAAAAATLRDAENLPMRDPACAARVRQLAEEMLATR